MMIMADIIVIAEMNNKKLSPVTNELVTAALKMSSDCKVVVPCNDSSLAEQAAKISGVSSVIAAKSDIFLLMTQKVGLRHYRPWYQREL